VRRSLIFVVAVAAVMVTAVAIWTRPTPDEPYGSPHPDDQLQAAVLRKATSLVYCNGRQMDLYKPDHARGPRPAVLYAHPGSWVLGDKSSGGYVDQLVPALTKRGFVVATINYRLGPRNPWPAQIQDAACAVRFLRAHHATYGINPARIGAWGASAGAQLVSLVGTMDRSAALDVGQYLDQSSRLQAVIDMYGPVDVPAFVALSAKSNETQGTWGAVMAADPDGLRKAGPGYWATRDDPPFLILQGDQDRTVPPVQSVAFAQRLRAAHIPTKLVMVRGAGHGLTDAGQVPSRNDLLSLTIRFFQQHLEPRP
jgi:acetyl esterase/lipase